jgi:hypothetical protein
MYKYIKGPYYYIQGTEGRGLGEYFSKGWNI